jgi:hypothetical protein
VLAMLLLSWILLGDWKIVNLFSVLGLMLPTSLRGGPESLSLPAWLCLECNKLTHYPHRLLQL